MMDYLLGVSGECHPFSCVFFPSFVTNTRPEVNCSFHCWQGLADLLPQWALLTPDRANHGHGLCLPYWSERSCWTRISDQFQSRAVWLPVGSNAELIRGQETHLKMTGWSQVSLLLVRVAVLPHCWLSRLLVCLNKQCLGTEQRSHLCCHDF